MGDVSRFKGSKLISATEREVRLATNDFKSGIQQISNSLIEKAEAKNLIVKLGAEGLVALANNPSYKTDSLMAFNSNPVDTAGAGDALLATVALAKKLGATIWEAAYLGNVAAAIQVSRLGNIPMKRDELIEVLMKEFAE
jgi:sugar/nucleoside kinase (ribokinase family)